MTTDTIDRADSVRFLHPLFRNANDPLPTPKARDLVFEECPTIHAVACVRVWHSRLPRCQNGPWTQSFRGQFDDVTFVVALWNTTSARTLPNDWRELRRLACAPDAPRNTPSRFLAWMVRWFQQHEMDCSRLISYQDTAVHTGTIYKAAGWIRGPESVSRVRDRSKKRAGTMRNYRSNINGADVDAASKIRWEKKLMEENR